MRRLAIWISTAGVAIWVVGVAAWMMGVWVTLPPDAVRPLVLALAAVVGGVLVATGAAVGRTAKGEAARSESRARADADLL
jgi:hypothetical protein